MRRHSARIASVLMSLFMALAMQMPLGAFQSRPVAEQSGPGLQLFKSRVRGILHEKCLKCHGGAAVKGDFDLSTREKLMASGFVEKTAASSHLVSLIEHSETPHMPFKAPQLAPKSILAIRRWIDLGAPYDRPLASHSGSRPVMQVTDEDRQFWSFQPLRVEEPASTSLDDWARTPVDRFIAEKLIENQLTPNARASRRVLIRRAYFNLLGLPPAPSDVEAFVQDPDPQAWSRLVDRVLESRHYGERWARHWMDVARFGESHGGEHDYLRSNAYHYRDFLIRAFNADMPFDQFARWQLAGDELAPDNPLAMMATGFLSAGTFPTQLTEAEFESARYDELDDMVTTTGVAFLGLSIGCARCHDHKFDPIPTRDYYRIVSAFGKAIRCEVDLDLEPEENRQRQVAWERRLAQLMKQASEYEQTDLTEKFRTWLASYDPSRSLNSWESVKVISVDSTGGSEYRLQPDGSLLAAGKVPAREVITLTVESAMPRIQALRLEALTHDSLPRKGPGRAPNGNFALGHIVVQAQSRQSEDQQASVGLSAARATHQQNTGGLAVAASIDNDPISGWAVDAGGIGSDQAAVFDFDAPVSFAGGTRLTVTLTFNHPNTQHVMGRMRLSVTDRKSPAAELGQNGPAPAVIEALAVVKQKPDEKLPEWKTALDWFATTVPDLQQLQQANLKHRQAGPKLRLTKVMLASEGVPRPNHHANGRGYPHFYEKTYFLKRGDVHQKGDVSLPGFLQVLSGSGKSLDDFRILPPDGWKKSGFERASFASWMTDTQHGAGRLVARVIVNRLWHHHFGQGIVATPNDFGFPGERPTHPRLLDWLASDLIANGWKLKRLHKLILTSSVFMQSSRFDAERSTRDPENRLLWRRVPRRLEAEAIRDAMLAVSGQLDPAMYGPGTLDQNSRRRSIYFTVKRSQLIPMMMLFDWPEHLVSIGRRTTTTIAPQALAFMNSPQGRLYASTLASRIQGSSQQVSIKSAYQAIFGREPDSAEQQLAADFLDRQQKVFDGAVDSPVRALADLCQMLMASSEFVFVD